MVDANLTAKGQAGRYPTPTTADKLPAALRNVMADELGEAMGEAAMPIADEVLENLREGQTSLKAPPAEERAINAQYKRMMKGVDIDGETAKIIAEDRLNEFRDKAEAAHESGDKEAYGKARENLLAALEEQPELEEAAQELSKPKGHHAREAYEAKRGGDVVEGIMQEEGHVARLKAERAAEPEQGKEGQAR